ncbi:PQQ-dependent sugar dehydrogenase [Halorutilales archaeon Cl-col2-1]
MDRRSFLRQVGSASVALTAGCLGSGEGDSGSSSGYDIETVVGGLTEPWGIEFIDDRRCLVTGRRGSLSLIDVGSGTAEGVEGVPEVYVAGQGGLLDVEVHPNYPDDPRVYLTYSATDTEGKSATHVGAGRLDDDTPRLEEFEVLHVAEPFVDSNNHYGSRATFGEDRSLYVTSGDRQFKNFGSDHIAQRLDNQLGAVLRLEDDGSVPSDNPFVDGEGADAVYSYGHRNPQGLTVHPETGEIWETEHGERDGDEINVIEKGENYGWPVATEACEYNTDIPVGVSHSEREDVVSPVYVWECGTGGFPPSGADFYDGDLFEDWQGDLLVGNLAGRVLGRFEVDGRDVEQVDTLLEDRGWRVRDVAVGDDGYVYLVYDGDGVPLVRLVPE